MVLKYYLYDEFGNKINSSFTWIRGLFMPTRVEIKTKASALSVGDVVYVKDESGNIVFKGNVIDKVEKDRGVATFIAMSEFHRMIEDYRAVTFYGKTNLEIVDALVDLYNYSDNVVVGFENTSGCSEVNVEYFAQHGYTLSEIYYLLSMSNCFFADYYDAANDKWVLRPKMLVDTGKIYYEGKRENNNGIVVLVRDLKKDKGNVVNKVLVKGKENIKTSDESGFVVDGSGEYNGKGYIKTNYKIYGGVKLSINGTEIVNFDVLNERGIVLVSSSYVGKKYEITYSWDDTPYVLVKDENSIRKYGERLKVYTIDTKDTNALLEYANTIKEMYKEPPIRALIEIINDEFDIGDKFYLKLFNPDTSSFSDAIELIVFEKIYSSGRYQYRVGNIGTIMSVMKNVLENLQVKLNLANITATNKLNDNDLSINIDWDGNLIGLPIGGGAKLYQNFQDGDTSVYRRFGAIEIVLGRSDYAYAGEENGYIVYNGSNSTFKMSRNSSTTNVNANLVFGGRFGRYDVNLHYVDGGGYIYVNGYSSGVCSKFTVDNLWSAYGCGIKYCIVYRDDLSGVSTTSDMLSISVGGTNAQFLFYAKKDDGVVGVYLKKISSGDERKLYTVSSANENVLKFILYFKSNKIVGGSGGNVRIYAVDENGNLFYFDESISSDDNIDVYVNYLGNGLCKGHVCIAKSADIINVLDDYNSNIYDVVIVREVIS